VAIAEGAPQADRRIYISSKTDSVLLVKLQDVQIRIEPVELDE